MIYLKKFNILKVFIILSLSLFEQTTVSGQGSVILNSQLSIVNSPAEQ